MPYLHRLGPARGGPATQSERRAAYVAARRSGRSDPDATWLACSAFGHTKCQHAIDRSGPDLLLVWHGAESDGPVKATESYLGITWLEAFEQGVGNLGSSWEASCFDSETELLSRVPVGRSAGLSKGYKYTNGIH